MATVTYHFPAGLYPNQYNPPLSGVSVNPSFGELVDMHKASRSTTTSTEVLYRLDNGLKVKLVGTGFSFDASGDAVGGTVTSIEVLLNNGVGLVQTITGLNVSLETFNDAAAAFDSSELESWLLSGDDTLNGSTGNDELEGHLGNDVLNAGAGDDIVTGGGGTDTYDGGAGIDTLNFRDAYDALTATRGINLDATAGTVIDQFGNSETFQNFEEFRGTQFSDRMIGSSVDETFMGFGGRDTIAGGAGIDTIRYDRDFQLGATKGVNVNLTNGVSIDSFGSQDALSGIENVRATDLKDTIVGNSSSNFIRAFKGNDFINGAGGADEMRGGAGNDTYYVDNAGDIVNETADSGAGTDTVRSSISFNLGNTAAAIGNLEHLTLLNTGNISGTGNSLNNTLTGNSGNNGLNGAGGNDLIDGGLGNDSLRGSTGLDTFLFSTALNAVTNVDTILDFNIADDTVRLENAIFDAIQGVGALTAAQFVSNTAGVADTSDQRIVYESDTGKLYYDSDGNGAAGSVHFATLGTNLNITASDFFVV
ncbi:calcium-binding protein [Sinorhizobium meliloti]|uniref:calcium-binding protein n=1 Tax=Rhizobium meliloti TaxID=382 RepID=UPI00020F3C99|nr:calcium-binding protein [Sinorhizobium meliloti]AEG56748.1 Hemolysin-type calcium-binding region [Sinorhizobium meliloti AK83]KKA13115.1 calcium-binding protein [Sinorhizobium meliloti]MDE4588419.1 calcium-binding protein [Sinorhizobium meliloti]MQX56035.1 calcium-binding protein [Sinorhizobium meliloti]RVM03749.1 calcium-binding protein [Sinorhizobium meliloti]